MHGNRSIGMAAWGARTRLTARNCSTAGNVDHAVYADGGAVVEMVGCALQGGGGGSSGGGAAAGSSGGGSSGGSAVQAWNAGTRVELRRCKLDSRGATAEVNGGKVLVRE
jgi:hypothetical protein